LEAWRVKLEVFKKPTLSDLLLICDRLCQDEREQYEAFTGAPYSRDTMAMGLALKPGPSWVLCGDGAPICAAGYDYIRPGVWQDWMINTPEAFGQHWRSTTKHVRKGMNAMLDQADVHRLQCVSLASRVDAHRWYAVLGLAPEGTLRAYGANGQDAIMFARVKDGPAQFLTECSGTTGAGTPS
jgi:hypothetical protein